MIILEKDPKLSIFVNSLSIFPRFVYSIKEFLNIRRPFWIEDAPKSLKNEYKTVL